MSMQAVSLSGSARDSLLISFRDAKLSVVEYDPEAHDLRTLSLHYFEEEEMRVCYNLGVQDVMQFCSSADNILDIQVMAPYFCYSVA